jgi:hypothetical protein
MNKLWELFNIKGGSIMGLYSLCMIALSCYVTIQQKPLDSGVVGAYGVAVGAFAYSRKKKEVKATEGSEE